MVLRYFCPSLDSAYFQIMAGILQAHTYAGKVYS